MPLPRTPRRLAIIVSHPVQYYVPLYRRLAAKSDLSIKVFFTWHGGDAAVYDRGFAKKVRWDIPLTEGYEFEVVPNTSSDAGQHHFFGLRNPSLMKRVMQWRPDAVHVTGWAWHSHLNALRTLHREAVPTLFRGDSHLLDGELRGIRWQIKRAVLNRVYSWPSAFLFVGDANRKYYERFGVRDDRLFPCPHSVDVGRFAEPAQALQKEAAAWRSQLDIPTDAIVVLFAGKFEAKKRPIELMNAVRTYCDERIVLIMAGGGELEKEVRAIAERDPARFRVLPFQNQSRMPVVYRLGDVFVLPSAYGETWGLAVNEAMACGVPVVVSDRVGCAADTIDDSCGRVFPWSDMRALTECIHGMTRDASTVDAMRRAATKRAWMFDLSRTEEALMRCLSEILPS